MYKLIKPVFVAVLKAVLFVLVGKTDCCCMKKKEEKNEQV